MAKTTYSFRASIFNNYSDFNETWKIADMVFNWFSLIWLPTDPSAPPLTYKKWIVHRHNKPEQRKQRRFKQLHQAPCPIYFNQIYLHCSIHLTGSASDFCFLLKFMWDQKIPSHTAESNNGQIAVRRKCIIIHIRIFDFVSFHFRNVHEILCKMNEAVCLFSFNI